MKRFLIPIFAMLILFGCGDGEGLLFDDPKSLPEIGDSCDTNAECGDRAFCDNDTLTCTPTTQFQKCSTSDDCARGLDCIDGVCQDQSQESCLALCDRLYEPVCGTDGVTYDNKCFAECNNADILKDGKCDPVCMDDAVCYLYCPDGFKKDANGCTTCECNTPTECKSDADCKDNQFCDLPRCDDPTTGDRCYGATGMCVEKPICGCPEYYAPVCGVDGKTYSNKCFAGCERVEIKHEGKCEDPMMECHVDSDCKDGYFCAYLPCDPTMSSEQCYDETGAMIGVGVCMKKEDPVCACPEYEAPVCGVNGKTYSNPCFAKCDNVEIKHDGQCEQVNCWEQCPGLLEPVCTTENQTYVNSCLAKCEGKEIQYEGHCKECQPVMCYLYCEYGFKKGADGCEICECNPEPDPRNCFSDFDCNPGEFCALMDCADGTDCYGGGICMKKECNCDDIYKPVCGANGQTYPNECVAHCDQVDVLYDGQCEEFCPEILCDANLWCEFGYKKDDRGCNTCECNPAPDHCNSNADCPAGEYCAIVNCITGTNCPEGNICLPYECPDVMCDMACEFGFKKDANGCEMCECNPDPNQKECFSDEDCLPHEQCIFLFYSETGTCNPKAFCDTDSDCPTGMKCELQYSENGDEYGSCVPSGEECQPVACELYCEFGFKKDDAGCEYCACNPDPNGGECGGIAGLECPAGMICILDDTFPDAMGRCVENSVCEPVTCDLWCPTGYKKDATGCETCECNETTIQCDSDRPCPEGMQCEMIDCTDADGTDCAPYGICH